MAEILRRCGDDLTRENVLKQANHLAGFHSPFFLDGVTYSYTPEDYTPMKTLYISIFNGKDWDISDRPVTEKQGFFSSPLFAVPSRPIARPSRPGGTRRPPLIKPQLSSPKLPPHRIPPAVRSR